MLSNAGLEEIPIALSSDRLELHDQFTSADHLSSTLVDSHIFKRDFVKHVNGQ